MGLAARQSEGEEDLDEAVRRTVECARAPSTRRLYSAKWGVFASWCRSRGHDPQTCAVVIVLRFLQFLFQRERAHSTLKVYVAAISAGRGALGVASVGRDPRVAQFLKGARRLRPPRGLRAPPWDLRLVLGSLVGAPYEPLDQADLKFLALKTLFLLAVCSAKRVGELHALSVDEECIAWKPEGAGVRLWPNPFFLPKVLSAQAVNQVIDLDAFASGQGRRRDSRLLCPVRALRAYVERTLPLRKSSQMFVCFGQAKLGQPASKSRGCLTGWSPLSPRRTRSEGFQCRWDWWAIPRVALPRRGLHYEESPSLIYAVRLRGPRRAHSPALQAECGFGHVPFRVSAAGGCTALVF